MMYKFSYSFLYLITLAILMVIDIPWILFLAKNFYTEQIGHLMATSPLYFPAVCFYLMYPAALVFFVIVPTLQQSLLQTFLQGLFFGFVVYGAYDFTNHATLKNWPLMMTIVDMAWGSFLSAIVSMLSLYLYRVFF